VQEGKSQPEQEKEAFFSAPGTLAAARISGCRNFSGVTRLSDRELLAEEWGMHLTLSLPVPADITHVGIRAQYIDAVPADEEAKDEACPANTADFDVVRIYEQQFESELILSSGQTPDGERHLMRILMSKDQADHLKECRRVRVNIRESDLLLLRE
jgi:molybdate transport system ATP-binding protein